MDEIKEFRIVVNESKHKVAVYQQDESEPLISGDDRFIYEVLIRTIADKIATNSKHTVTVFVHGKPGRNDNGIIYSTEE